MQILECEVEKNHRFPRRAMWQMADLVDDVGMALILYGDSKTKTEKDPASKFSQNSLINILLFTSLFLLSLENARRARSLEGFFWETKASAHGSLCGN